MLKQVIALAVAFCILGVDGQSRSRGRSPARSSRQRAAPNRRPDERRVNREETSSRRGNNEGNGGSGRGGCRERYERKEIRELSREELRDFHAALNEMKEAGVYDRFCRQHLENVPFAHATPYFLPWHREFTYRFEQELRRVNPSLTLPYWNWSLDAQAPERSAVLGPAYFGSQGGRCVDDGPLAGWRCTNPDEHCLGRSYDGGETLGAFYSPELLRFTLDDTETYDEFRRAIEGPPHGNVHNNIGGDMSTMASCNDPLFYMHHGFVDKLWSDWQAKDQGRVMDFGGPGIDGSRASLEDSLVPFDISVGDAMDVNSRYCYTYSNGPRVPRRASPPRSRRRERRAEDAVKSPGPHDRDDMTRMRFPTELSEEFIRMFNLNRTHVREQEKRDRAHVERLNLSGYISDFALGVNGLLFQGISQVVDAVDNLATGGELKSLPADIFGVVGGGKPIVAPSDFNILHNILF